MAEDKSTRTGHGGDSGDRILEGSEGRKGIIVMPEAQVIIDVQDMAPGGLPAPAQSAPPEATPPPPPASEL